MGLKDRRTALYRFYDEGGALLYVGITEDIETRWEAHERLKPWWLQVASNTVEWFDTRPEARAAELAAINRERPVHNVADSPWAPGPRELGERELSITQLRSNLTEYATRARIAGEVFTVVSPDRRRKPVAVLISPELYQQLLDASLGSDT